MNLLCILQSYNYKMVTRPRLLTRKRVFLVMTAQIFVILLLILDIPGRYEANVVNHSENNQNSFKKRCENCVWGKRFKTQNVTAYDGGRELPVGTLDDVTVLSESQCRQSKLLVYKCDFLFPCGGWADRQKGIVTTFLLALLTNRKFVIDMTSPCKLEHFLSPNVYNWSLCKSYIQTIPNQNISLFNYVDKYKFNTEIHHFDFEGKYTKDVVLVWFNTFAIDGIRKHKLAKARLKWLLDMTNEEVIHRVLNTLFKPNEKLLNNAISFYDNNINGRKLMCSHIRKGGNPSIPTDLKRRHSPNETLILEFLKRYDKTSDYVIYIASDSDEVKRHARDVLTSYININQTIVHIDRLGTNNKTEACHGFYTAILEQFILSLCDGLFLTFSGFGTIAAYMRGISEEIYVYPRYTDGIVHSNLTGIQLIFKFTS